MVPPRATYLFDAIGYFSSTAHNTTAPPIFADDFVTLSRSEYNFLIQKMHSVSTSDIVILAHSGISYLVSSLPSSWIIDSSASTHMTSKSIAFFTFSHTSYVPSVVFVDGSSKSITGSGTVNLTSSLALFDVNNIHHVLFNLASVSHLTKTLNFSKTFFPCYTFQDLQTKKMIDKGMSEMIGIIFSTLIKLK